MTSTERTSFVSTSSLGTTSTDRVEVGERDRVSVRPSIAGPTSIVSPSERPVQVREELPTADSEDKAYSVPTSLPIVETTPRAAWHEAMKGLNRISIDPLVQSGTPTIRDTRISVSQVIEVLSDVGSIRTVVSEFANVLEAQDITESLLFVSRLVR